MVFPLLLFFDRPFGSIYEIVSLLSLHCRFPFCLGMMTFIVAFNQMPKINHKESSKGVVGEIS